MSQTAVNAYQTDQIVKSAEVIAILQRTRELGALGLCALLGNLNASANADGTEGLACVATGGLNVRVGDTASPPKQMALLLGLLADYCPAVTLTAVAATGTRYDYVGVQYAADVTSTFTTQFFNPTTKTTSNGSANATNDGFAAQIFEGNGTPGQQATYVPAGWVALAQLTVVNSAVTAVTPLLTSISQQLSLLETLINGNVGPFTIEGDPSSPTAVTVTTVPGDPTVLKIAVAASSAPVTSVNGQTGAVMLVTGVSSVNGATGAVTFAFPVTSVNGQTGAVSLTFVSSINSQTGAVTLESTDGSVTVTQGGGIINLTNAGANGGAIGTTLMVSAYSSGHTPETLTLPTLGPGNWNTLAIFRGGSTGGSASMTGSGATWPSGDTTVGNSVNENVMMIAGTATSGQAPSVSVAFSGGFSETCTVALFATRIS